MFNIPPPAKVIWKWAMAKSLMRQTGGAVDQAQDPWVQGQVFIHYTMAAASDTEGFMF